MALEEEIDVSLHLCHVTILYKLHNRYSHWHAEYIDVMIFFTRKLPSFKLIPALHCVELGQPREVKRAHLWAAVRHNQEVSAALIGWAVIADGSFHNKVQGPVTRCLLSSHALLDKTAEALRRLGL